MGSPVLSRCRDQCASLSLILLIRINEEWWRLHGCLLLCGWSGDCLSNMVSKPKVTKMLGDDEEVTWVKADRLTCFPREVKAVLEEGPCSFWLTVGQ